MKFVSRLPIQRRRHSRSPLSRPIEMLEERRMFCEDPAIFTVAPHEQRPDLLAKAGHATSDVSDPADIVWINRATTTAAGSGDTDLFGARFGANAPAARAVVDAVIASYERMIGSFNYASAGQTYNVTVNAASSANSGLGASASLTSTFGGIPKTGTITMGSGSGAGGAGWFFDPTPYDNSEFLGNIVNGFSGDAISGSPAYNKSDFFTVVAAEMTHCMGLFGNNTPGWAAHTSSTTVPDTAEGGGIGKFVVFNGPSIQHLLTTNNGGSGGQDAGFGGIHTAGPITTTINSVVYNGAQDQGNAVYEGSRRYIVNDAFALMFKDAFNYATVDPSKFGTFYSILNQTTGKVTVRGGQSGSSADNISVTRSGSTITVSVDVGNDIGGTGALPGPGNLPAFVTQYDISQVNSISIAGGDGNDTITVGPNIGVNVAVDGGIGTDTLVIQGDAGDNALAYTGTTASSGSTLFNSIAGIESTSFDGAGGNDSLTLTASANADFLNVGVGTVSGSFSVSYSNIESLFVNTGAGADTVVINSPAVSVLIDVGSDGDVISINTTAPGNSVSLAAGATGLAGTSVNVNADYGDGASFSVPSSITLQDLSVTPAGTVSGTGDLTLTNSLTFTGGTIGGSGQLTIGSGATVTASGPDLKTLSRVLRSSSDLNISGGTLQVTAGLSGPATALTTAALGVTGLNLSGDGTLDLTDNAAIIDYNGGSPLDLVRTSLLSGYNGGAWTGTGIVSSSAAATTGRAIGYSEASALFSVFPGTFANTPIDSTSVVLRYTVTGDANLDGTVGFSDLLSLAQNFNAPGPLTWRQGDFNYDGLADFSDLLKLAQNFNSALSIGAMFAAKATPTPVVASPVVASSAVARAAAPTPRSASVSRISDSKIL